MRILVTGAQGMLGQDLVTRLEAEHTVIPTDRDTVDITSPSSVSSAVRGVDALVNCAAWTAVDDAESRESDAFTLNAVAPQILARAAASIGVRLVQVSTDYVFDGVASSPYQEDELALPASAYGRTKAAGEWAVRASGADHLIVRTAWLYGAFGPNFPRTMARLAADRESIEVVNDQTGQPTWAADVADLIARLLEAEVPAGTYHATSSGQATWFDFAQAVMRASGREEGIIKPTTSAGFIRPAPRPTYSVLGHQALVDAGIAPIGNWRERWDIAAQSVLALPA